MSGGIKCAPMCLSKESGCSNDEFSTPGKQDNFRVYYRLLELSHMCVFCLTLLFHVQKEISKGSTCLWFKATAISSSLWFLIHTSFWFHRNQVGGNLAPTSLLCFPFVISVCLRAMEEEISTIHILVPIQEGSQLFCTVQTASYYKMKVAGCLFP